MRWMHDEYRYVHTAVPRTAAGNKSIGQLWIVRRHMLETVHRFQGIKICKPRDECGPAKGVQDWKRRCFHLPVKLSTALAALCTVGGAVPARAAAAPGRRKRPPWRAKACCFTMYVAVRGHRGKQRTARGPTVHQPALVQQSGCRPVDGRRKKNARPRTSQ